MSIYIIDMFVPKERYMDSTTLSTTVVNTHTLPDDILLGLRLFSIPDLFFYRTICKELKVWADKCLQVHHKRFMSRLKLYSTIVNKCENRYYCSPDEITVQLHPCIEHCKRNDPIIRKYYQEPTLNQNLELSDNSDYNDFSDDCDESDYYDDDVIYFTNEAYISDLTCFLNGDCYEHDYYDQHGDFSVICVVCKQYAFLPVMIKFVGSSKDYRSDSRSYFPIFGASCLKCIDNIKASSVSMTSLYYEDAHVMIGMSCYEFFNHIMQYCDQINPLDSGSSSEEQ